MGCRGKPTDTCKTGPSANIPTYQLLLPCRYIACMLRFQDTLLRDGMVVHCCSRLLGTGLDAWLAPMLQAIVVACSHDRFSTSFELNQISKCKRCGRQHPLHSGWDVHHMPASGLYSHTHPSTQPMPAMDVCLPLYKSQAKCAKIYLKHRGTI